MRRAVTTLVTVTALAAAGLVVAPVASAAPVDPTVTSTKATPKKILIQVGSGAQATATATFNDPDATINQVRWTVFIPGGGQYGPYTTAGTTIGDSRTFEVKYYATTSNQPGKYRVKFEPLPKTGITFGTTPIANVTFIVQHRTKIFVSNGSSAQRGSKVKFYGRFYPQNPGVKGQKLTLWFQPKGSKKFTKVDKTQVSKLYNYNFGKRTVKKSGKYRVKFAGSKYLRATKIAQPFTVY
jgi:hypothetical protein